MRLRRSAFGLIATVVVSAGCPISPFTPKMCTLELRSALVVHIVDARTGAPIANGATVLVAGPAFQDSTVLTRDTDPYVAFEDRAKAGRYTVIVRKPAYIDYVNDGIRVTADECHVTGKVFDAPLTAR